MKKPIGNVFPVRTLMKFTSLNFAFPFLEMLSQESNQQYGQECPLQYYLSEKLKQLNYTTIVR